MIWRSLAAEAAARFPGLPLVGYEAAEMLVAPGCAGFERAGLLRIWSQATEPLTR